MATKLNPGSLDKLKSDGSVQEAVALRVMDLQENNGKLKCQLSDGKGNMPGVLTSPVRLGGSKLQARRGGSPPSARGLNAPLFYEQVISAVPSPCTAPPPPQVARQFGATLKSNDIVRITEGNVNSIEDKQILIVAAMELVEAAAPKEDVPMAEAAPVAAVPAAAPATDAKTPAAAIKTTGTAAAAGKTPASGPTPPSGKAAARAVQPISALNPYMHGWAIRAKVVSKGPKRSFNRAGAPSSVFSAELVDEQGTAIEGTFWRDAADKHYDSLEEGKVYVFARGQVKPANKAYNRTRNDYCLNFDGNAEVEPCGEWS